MVAYLLVFHLEQQRISIDHKSKDHRRNSFVQGLVLLLNRSLVVPKLVSRSATGHRSMGKPKAKGKSKPAKAAKPTKPAKGKPQKPGTKPGTGDEPGKPTPLEKGPTPSKLEPADITDLYKLPDGKLKTEEDVIKMKGYKLEEKVSNSFEIILTHLP